MQHKHPNLRKKKKKGLGNVTLVLNNSTAVPLEGVADARPRLETLFNTAIQSNFYMLSWEIRSTISS